MTDSLNARSYKSILEMLADPQGRHPTPPIRIATKRSRHSARFAVRIQKNAEVADKLIEVIKSLNKKAGTETDVDKLLDLVKQLLENNAKLREQVGEALQDIPN